MGGGGRKDGTTTHARVHVIDMPPKFIKRASSDLEALEGAVVGVEQQLGRGAQLRRAVPPVCTYMRPCCMCERRRRAAVGRFCIALH